MFFNKWIFKETAKHTVLLTLSIIILMPIAWMVITSFKTEKSVFSGPAFWPDGFNLYGYAKVFTDLPILRWMANSLIIAILQVSGQIFISILAAYAFAHFRFRYREVLFFFVLMTMMIPQQVTMIPTYLIVNNLNWLNSFQGVIVPHLASGYAIFLLRQSFLIVPRELTDAAEMDGCGALRTLRHVYISTSLPMISALAAILFVGIWNDYQWPLLVLIDKMIQPLPVALTQFRVEGSLEYVPTMAVATLSTLPVIILFLAAQRNFIEGFSSSGIKG